MPAGVGGALFGGIGALGPIAYGDGLQNARSAQNATLANVEAELNAWRGQLDCISRHQKAHITPVRFRGSKYASKTPCDPKQYGQQQ